ncbi:MAG: thioredoxin 1 [Myxococcota bacterium]|jgi:thioredoxin 1
MASDKVLTFTDQNFETEVINSDIPVLVDFWAVWCGPCRAVAPIIDELAETYDGKVKIGKVNVDENRGTATAHKISSIPTLLVFKGGKVVQQIVGARPKRDFESALDAVIS